MKTVKATKTSKAAKVLKPKEPVRMRLKQLADGRQSIYFDIYRDGKREYEFPKLYIVPETNETDKEKNRETLDIANKLKSKMILEMDHVGHGFTKEKEAGKQKENFIKYLRELTEKRKADGLSSMYYLYRGLTNHLEKYKGENVIFRNVTKEYCKGFVDYLKSAKNGTYGGNLSEGSQAEYSRLLTVALNSAMQDGYMQTNPMKLLSRHERPKQPESDREFLTVDEIKALANTPCVKDNVKQSFLFTCYSGMRFSDVENMRWGDIQKGPDGEKVIRYTQKKTKKNEYLQVSYEALKQLPERNGASDNDKIFNLSRNGYTNQVLAVWVLAAGIKKRVTFHVARHTNATLLLSLGVGIETVSKLLGHSDIKTTQIYAKVVDKSKREAVSKLSLLLG